MTPGWQAITLNAGLGRHPGLPAWPDSSRAGFKAVGLALRHALEATSSVFSTKGRVRWEVG